MKLSDVLSAEELKFFTQRSDLSGAWMVVFNWAFIITIFAAVSIWTNPLSLLLGVLLLGGRQMGLAVLMHEAGHRTLFKSQRLNAFVGQWLCAYPIMGDYLAYAASHREHHRYAGTDSDPDLPNYRAYPVSRASFIRKIGRDLTGKTGLKLLQSLFTGQASSIMMRSGEKNGGAWQGLLVNVVLLLILFLLGIGELYTLWVAAYLTSYPLIARIRQVAEHGNAPDLYDLDPRLNTRTTIPRLIERAVLCPNYVNYHVEHHLLASVPSYRLKQLHETLVEKGFYAEYQHTLAYGYWDVLKRAVPELGRNQSTAT